jgi:hypothetical protein
MLLGMWLDTELWMSRKHLAGHRWLTAVILATQEAEIRRMEVGSQLGQTVRETISKTLITKKGLVEWLKV